MATTHANPAAPLADKSQMLAVPSSGTPPRPKLPPTKTTANRLPPPSLFQGPPSHNASHVSLTLPGASAAAVGVPLSATVSHAPSQQPEKAPRFSNITESRGSFFGLRPQAGDAKIENDRADALWAEMQNTLAEVELSAVNRAHVFGAEHGKALEDLRTTQLSLAHAWAKSEAEEVDSTFHEDEENKIGGKGAAVVQQGANAGKRAGGGKGSRENSPRRVSKNLEEETERDILLARMRREANDRYFQQVNSGVLDVVAKLEEVAGAMRKVEKESREIWSESDGSGSTTGSATEKTTETEGERG